MTKTIKQIQQDFRNIKANYKTIKLDSIFSKFFKVEGKFKLGSINKTNKQKYIDLYENKLKVKVISIKIKENKIKKKAIKKINKALKDVKERKIERYSKDINKKIPLEKIDESTEINFSNLNELKKKLIVDRLLKTENRYLIQFDNGKTYTLNEDIIKLLLNEQEEAYNSGSGSDQEVISYIMKVDKIKLKLFNRKIKDNGNLEYAFLQGEFFAYEHNLKGRDFSNLQIYEDFKPEYYTQNCFVNCLIQSGLEEKIINDCKLIIKSKHTSLKSIKDIATKHNLRFKIRVDRVEATESRSDYRYYGSINDPEIKIGLLRSHYFPIIPVPITRFAIINYDKIKHLDNWWEIYDKKNNRDKEKFTDSFNLVKQLILNEEKLLRPIQKSNMLDSTAYFDTIKDIQSLEYNEETNTKLNEYKEKRKNDYTNVFFDFETFTSGEKHIPYLCCVKSGYYEKSFIGVDCGRQMLDAIHKDFKAQPVKLIAHNISYDLKFIFHHLYQPNFIRRGNMVLCGTGKYYSFNKGQDLKFQDSYALISCPLSKFGKMFNLEQEKEFMPYNLYDNLKRRYIPIEEDTIKNACIKQVQSNNIGQDYDKKLEEEYYKKYMDNAIKWDCITKDRVDVIKYSECYCKMDCLVLEKGYKTFQNQIETAFDLSLDEFVSSASLSNAVMLNEGVYEGVYKLNGVPREFIQLCMVGGRTMVRKNKKYTIENKKLADFDAVSLYPSAMSRLDGFLIGRPKILKTTDYNIIKNYDGYFVEVKIKSVGIKRAFPLLSFVDEKTKVRNFSNDMENKIVHLDKCSLEDAIKFQNIEFEIIRGYYYDEGRNNRLTEVINNMFQERLKYKKLKNPIQELYKLIMNSSYGITLLKPIDEQTTYIKGKVKWESFVKTNYVFHKETTCITDPSSKDKDNIYEVKTIKSVSDHFNNAHCGVEVLSMSKRIMNEVMTLAEDKEFKIYYQDTDSMHIDNEEIKELALEFKNKYNRDLIGKGMGQFHVDFSSNILTGEILARKSIFLGKKCYIDELVDDETNKVDYHIRMKGISGSSILYHSQKDFEGNPMKLYEHLALGKPYSFDLTCSGMKCCFETIDMSTIRTKVDFKRVVKF